MEVIARNQYTGKDDKDPVACTLFYLALRKKKLLHGLWRTAHGHAEQAKMVTFLANDFDQDRWKTAALKNAFALLGKQRFGNYFTLQSLQKSLASRNSILMRPCVLLF